jgi:hypothetical protein
LRELKIGRIFSNKFLKVKKNKMGELYYRKKKEREEKLK